jgi:hypothetical protein
MEAASTCETSVNFYQTTWCNNLEDSHLYTCHHDNLVNFYQTTQHNTPEDNHLQVCENKIHEYKPAKLLV